MSKFKWMVFVQNSELTLNPEKLKIPYNCEFVIIRPETTSSYKLVEYYTTTNRFFAHEFGTWNDRFGLKTTNISFYWRRLDLNRTRITTLTIDGVERVSKKNGVYEVGAARFHLGTTYLRSTQIDTN